LFLKLKKEETNTTPIKTKVTNTGSNTSSSKPTSNTTTKPTTKDDEIEKKNSMNYLKKKEF